MALTLFLARHVLLSPILRLLAEVGVPRIRLIDLESLNLNSMFTKISIQRRKVINQGFGWWTNEPQCGPSVPRFARSPGPSTSQRRRLNLHLDPLGTLRVGSLQRLNYAIDKLRPIDSS